MAQLCEIPPTHPTYTPMYQVWPTCPYIPVTEHPPPPPFCCLLRLVFGAVGSVNTTDHHADCEFTRAPSSLLTLPPLQGLRGAPWGSGTSLQNCLAVPKKRGQYTQVPGECLMDLPGSNRWNRHKEVSHSNTVWLGYI